MTKIHCNTGFVDANQKGTITGYGIVWFNRNGIANIISMANSAKKFPITYDRNAGDKFILHKDSEQIIFNWSPSGLYFHDNRDRDILMVGTTNENCEGHTSQEIAAATKARAGLAMVGNPSAGDYINMVRAQFLGME